MQLFLLRIIESRALVVVLLLVALVERFGWALKRGLNAEAGEAQNVAMALANGRGFSDAYFVGAGPTAHLMPTTPLLAGAIQALVGPGSQAAELVLQILASAEMVVAYLLLFGLFARLGSAREARVAALAFMCAVPLFLGQESLDFRYWEGEVAVILTLLSLWVIVNIDKGGKAPPSVRDQTLLILLLAATAFVSPPLGVGLALGAVLLGFRRWTWPTRIRTGLLTIAVFGLMLAPWALRNEHMLGKPILLRSNAGLELTIALNDLALAHADGSGSTAMMAAIHPTLNGQARDRVRQVGEVAYMAELSTRTKTWIAEHPGGFALLSLRHIREMLLPSAFEFTIGSGALAAPRAAIFSLISVFGLVGIAMGIRGGRIGYSYVALVIAGAVLSYAPFQPMARYLYLIYGLLAFAAFDAAWRLAAVALRRLGIRVPSEA